MKKLTPRQLDAQHRVFSVLSNLNRVTILNYLRAAKGPVTAADIEKATGINHSKVYAHVQVLRNSGLVKAADRTRNGPVAATIELADVNDELGEFHTWFEGAATFKKLFKAPRQERARAHDSDVVSLFA